MFSFRSITLAATLAFAAFSFAAPVENVGGLNPAGLTTSTNQLQGATGATNSLTHVVHPRGQQGAADHFKICHDSLLGIKTKLVAILEVDIVVEEVVKVLGEVVIALNVLVASLRVLIGTGADIYCLSGGLIITLEAIAEIVCVLLTLVFEILCLVLKLVVHIEIKNLVCEIVAILLVVVQLVLEIVVGLGPILCGVVGVLLVHIRAIVACLSIDALVKLCALLKIVL